MRNLISLIQTALRKYGFAFCFAVALWFSIFIGTFGSLYSLSAQTTQDSVRAEIEEYAERHAKNGGAMDTGLIIELFGEEAEEVGFTTREVAEIYEEAYVEASAPNPESPWSVFLPKPEWVLIAVLAVFAALNSAFGEWLKDKFSELIKWFDDKVFAGNPLFLGRYLKFYREALVEKHSLLKIPFRLNRPLDMAELYVPLKVAGAVDREQIEARQAVANNKRLMVKGPPGSGKSILLRKLTLDYASQKLEFTDQPIPVLLELHRLSDPSLTVEKLKSEIVQALARDDFPKADRFVERSLEKGQLMLLLDGLDEVNSSIRKQVAQRIKDLLDTYPCRAIITCRTQVYEGEFDAVVDQTLEIVEFSDQQIRRFLRAWKNEMPPGKSVEQLIVTLRDRPRIMALARNPLLLTIIAYLYTDTPFVLPHSRAEFYQKATDILLEQWQKDFNQYKAVNKKRVLQHLALYNQDNADPQQKDRRSMDRYTVLEQIKQILPSLNLDAAKDTEPILAEIVERSGLLLRIDGGARYQFAHLTLQEYFSAAALVADEDKLIKRFQADPNAWRETVKLWCGLAGNSTELIRAVYQVDSLTGFECLADAQEVDEALATQIIEEFKQRFNCRDETDDPGIIGAFGIVAADTRPRGQQVFVFLDEQLKANNSVPTIKVAYALAATNLPKAAEAIAAFCKVEPFVGKALVKMGDLAVTPLKNLAEGDSWIIALKALDDLRSIGTPDAALALTSFLWHEQPFLAGRSAWHLAALLCLPEVEEALIQYQPTPEQRNSPKIEWIWQPFERISNSSTSIIAGQVAYLLESSTGDAFPEQELTDHQIDPRFGIPLFAIRAVQQGKVKWQARWNDQAENLLTATEDSENIKLRQASIAKECFDPPKDARSELILNGLEPKLQLQVVRRMSQNRSPDEVDWRNLNKPVKFNFARSIQYWFVLAISFCLSIAAIVEVTYLADQEITWIFGFAGLVVLILVTNWLFLWDGIEIDQRLEPRLFQNFTITGITTAVRQLWQLYRFQSVWTEIEFLQKTMADSIVGALALAVAVAVAVTVAGTGAMAGTGAGVWALALAVDLVVAVVVALAMAWAGVWALAGAVAGAGAVALVGAGAGAGAGAGVLVGIGVGFWQRAKKKKDAWRFLAILAFPLFCSAPIALGFSLGALYHLVPGITTWWQAAAVLTGIVLICTAVWQHGQWKERKATNPLHGLLDPKQYGIEVK